MTKKIDPIKMMPATRAELTKKVNELVGIVNDIIFCDCTPDEQCEAHNERVEEHCNPIEDMGRRCSESGGCLVHNPAPEVAEKTGLECAECECGKHIGHDGLCKRQPDQIPVYLTRELIDQAIITFEYLDSPTPFMQELIRALKQAGGRQ